MGIPFVILTTGQSQDTTSPPFAYRPSANAKIWNNPLGGDGFTGTDYIDLVGTTCLYPEALASEIARVDPSRDVRVINVAFSGHPIEQWLPGAATGGPLWDVFANIQLVMPPALAALGVSKIDLFDWWQGEGSADPVFNANYITVHATMMERFYSQTIGGVPWFPRTTPILIKGISSSAISGIAAYDAMNVLLQAVADSDPVNRRFLDTAALTPTADYWNGIHMHGLGYFTAAAKAARLFLPDDLGPPSRWPLAPRKKAPFAFFEREVTPRAPTV